MDHLDYYTNHTLSIITGKTGSCRPLYDVFDAIRQLLCRHVMDPMNGLWFFSFLCLILWLIMTPVSLALATTFKNINIFDKKLKRSSSSYRYVCVQFKQFIYLIM